MPSTAKRPCSIAGCGKPRFKRGYCADCYQADAVAFAFEAPAGEKAAKVEQKVAPAPAPVVTPVDPRLGGGSLRAKVDRASLVGLDMVMGIVPGGTAKIPDLAARRGAGEAFYKAAVKDLPPNTAVAKADREAPGAGEDPGVPVRVYSPAKPAAKEGEEGGAEEEAAALLPAILYIHGGGMQMGSVEQDGLTCESLVTGVGAVVVSVEYRLAPEHPYPAPVRDCYASLLWLFEHCAELGVDPARVAVMGGSAGGNLAIATALKAKANKKNNIAYLMAMYPMLDDRHVSPSSQEIVDVGVWDRSTNVEAWKWYLGGGEADSYAAPARASAEELAGLPPTFLDVGTLDLFRDEDVTFASRLLQCGVPTEFHVYPGAFHASEVFSPAAPLSQLIWGARFVALKRVLYAAL